MILDGGYGICPNIILFDNDVSPKELRVFIYISSLCAKKGFCRASNEHLAERLGGKARTYSRVVNNLKGKGYIITWMRKYKVEDSPGELRTVRYIKLGNKVMTPQIMVDMGSTHFPEDIDAKNGIDLDEEHTSMPKMASTKDIDAKNGKHNNTKLNNNTIKLIEQTEKEEMEMIELAKPVQTGEVLKKVRSWCKQLGFSYSGSPDEDFKFAKHIGSAHNFGEFAASIGKTRIEFARGILLASVQMDYFKGPLTSAELIYRNYSEVYNRRKVLEMKKDGTLKKNKEKQKTIESLPGL